MLSDPFNSITNHDPSTAVANSNQTVTVPASTIPMNIGMSTGVLPGVTTYGTGISSIGHGMFSVPKPTNVISLRNTNGKEIVKVNLDGSVTWADKIDIDASAEAFARSLQLGTARAAGISNAVKLRMRDSVFEDLIKIAKDKGSLTAEDLTYLFEASKIVEKLRGEE
jgi:hypothetical protein